MPNAGTRRPADHAPRRPARLPLPLLSQILSLERIVVPPAGETGRIEPSVEGASYNWTDDSRILQVHPSRSDHVEVQLNVR